MRSTMQERPLLVADIFRHGRQVHGQSEVLTFEGDGFRRTSFADVADRADKLAAALHRLGVRRGDRVGDLLLQPPGARRGVSRGSEHGRRAAHAQRAVVPRAAPLRHRPRRGQGHHRRRAAGARSRPGARRARHRRARHRRRRRGRCPRSARPCATTTSSTPRSPATNGRTWTRPKPPPCASRAGRRGTPRASSTATAPPFSTPSPARRRRRSGSPATTGSSSSSPNSTPMRGGSLRRLVEWGGLDHAEAVSAG